MHAPRSRPLAPVIDRLVAAFEAGGAAVETVGFDARSAIDVEERVVLCLAIDDDSAMATARDWFAAHRAELEARRPWLVTVSGDDRPAQGSPVPGSAGRLALGRRAGRDEAAMRSVDAFAERVLADGELVRVASPVAEPPAQAAAPARLTASSRGVVARRRPARRGPGRLPLLLGSLAALVIAAVVVFGTGLVPTPWRPSAPAGPLTTVTGVVGSEKTAFFADPEVQAVLAEHGYRVEVEKSGSFRMAQLPDLATNDFAFPASEIAALNIETKVGGVIGTHQPFYSPMAIATFEPIVELLAGAGAASRNEAGTWTIDLERMLELIREDVRWRDLPGASGVYDSPRSILFTSTDVRSSNSAAMYLSLAAYVETGNAPPTTPEQADALMPLLERLFLDQGYAGASSSAPFDDYLELGMGAVPMVMIYEGQFIGEQLATESRIGDDMVLAYPGPTIFSEHTGVTFSEDGEAVMRLLSSDRRLARLVAAHGFRPLGEHAGEFRAFLDDRGIGADYRDPGDFHHIASEPSYEMLDRMLTELARRYDVSGAPAATPEGETPAARPPAPPATEPAHSDASAVDRRTPAPSATRPSEN